jgi:hypothetical protein
MKLSSAKEIIASNTSLSVTLKSDVIGGNYASQDWCDVSSYCLQRRHRYLVEIKELYISN